MQKNIFAALLIFLVSFLSYQGTLSHEFTVDSLNHIQDNPLVFKLENIPQIFTSPAEPGNLFRPVLISSYAINYHFSKLDPWSYHLCNVVLHSFVSLLLFFFALNILKFEAAVLAGVLFAVHPLHTEAVANVANGSEVYAAFFGLSAILLFLKNSPLSLLLGSFSLLAAVFSKESGFTIIPLFLWTVIYLHGFSDGLRRSLKGFACCLIVSGIYFYLRSVALGGQQLNEFPISPVDNPLIALETGERIVNGLSLLCNYLYQCFLPLNLSADYSFAKLMPLTFQEALPKLVFCLVLLGAALASLIRKNIFSYSLGWFFIAFLVTANILTPIGTIYAERLAYLPSASICLLLAHILCQLKPKLLSIVCLSLVLAFYVIQTYLRAEDWSSNQLLAKREIVLSPKSVRANVWYAATQRQVGRLDLAEKHLLAALKLHPVNAEARFELARVKFQLGKETEAEEELLEVLEIADNHIPSLLLLAHFHREAHRLGVAEDLFKLAISHEPNNVEAHLGIAAIGIAAGDKEKAYFYLDKVKNIAPQDKIYLELLETSKQMN